MKAKQAEVKREGLGRQSRAGRYNPGLIAKFTHKRRRMLAELPHGGGDDAYFWTDDNEPGMCLTVGFTPKTEEKDYSWGYQTGDNSYTGGAYSHPHWAVVYLSRDSKPSEIAEEISGQIAELVWQ